MMRAQLGLEFVIVFGLALLVFFFVQVHVYSTRGFIESQTAGNHAARIAEEVSMLISTAAHSDSTAQFSLPSFLSTGFNYTAVISNNTLVLKWDEFGRTSELVNFIEVDSVVNSTGSANFTLLAGQTYKANSSNGVVEIR